METKVAGHLLRTPPDSPHPEQTASSLQLHPHQRKDFKRSQSVFGEFRVCCWQSYVGLWREQRSPPTVHKGLLPPCQHPGYRLSLDLYAYSFNVTGPLDSPGFQVSAIMGWKAEARKVMRLIQAQEVSEPGAQPLHLEW